MKTYSGMGDVSEPARSMHSENVQSALTDAGVQAAVEAEGLAKEPFPPDCFVINVPNIQFPGVIVERIAVAQDSMRLI